MSARKAQPGAARTQSYRAAAEQLARIEAELEAGETDLDKVLPLLAEAQAAYQVCKERINALRAALEETAPLGDELATDEADSTEDTKEGPEDDDGLYF